MGVHYVISLYWMHSYMDPPTVLGSVEEILLRPAWLLSSAVLPTRYAYIICEGTPPSDLGRVTGTTLVFFNTLFWTSLVALLYVSVRRLRHAMYVQRI